MEPKVEVLIQQFHPLTRFFSYVFIISVTRRHYSLRILLYDRSKQNSNRNRTFLLSLKKKKNARVQYLLYRASRNLLCSKILHRFQPIRNGQRRATVDLRTDRGERQTERARNHDTHARTTRLFHIRWKFGEGCATHKSTRLDDGAHSESRVHVHVLSGVYRSHAHTPRKRHGCLDAPSCINFCKKVLKALQYTE